MVWFRAAYLLITDKRGFSALAPQRQLGIARYETAWMILHKLRRTTVIANRTRLRGIAEMDEARIGSVQGGESGRERYGPNAARSPVEDRSCARDPQLGSRSCGPVNLSGPAEPQIPVRRRLGHRPSARKGRPAR
jgi:hypothetical protein